MKEVNQLVSNNYIGVDFDGTCVTHEYPNLGTTLPNVVEVLKELVNNNNKLILFTMRSGKELKDAEKWFEDNDIELFASQTNPTQKSWTDSPKAHCHIYIDDAALGCPLIYPENGDIPYVDWNKVRTLLKQKSNEC